MRLREPLVRPAPRLDVDPRQRLVAARAARGELDHGLEDASHRPRAASSAGDLVALLGLRPRRRRARSARSGRGPSAWPSTARRRRSRAARRPRRRPPAPRPRPRRPPAAARARSAPPAPPAPARRSPRPPRRRRPGRISTNSSPPSRPTTSPSRTTERSRSAAAASTRSPSAWPSVSLMTLKWSRSISTTATLGPPRERRAQPLVAGAVVEQPGQPVALDLLAQRLALARRVVGQRGHRREALDELDLLVAERRVARPVRYTFSAPSTRSRASSGTHTNASGSSGVPATTFDSGSCTTFGHVARLAVLDHPAGHAGPERDRVLEHLVHPAADREHRAQQRRGLVDLVDRQVVVVQQRAQVVRDPPERALERIRGQNAGSRLDQRLERGSTSRLEAKLHSHIPGHRTPTSPSLTARLHFRVRAGVAQLARATAL